MNKIVIMFLIFSLPCLAAEDNYQFSSVQEQERFTNLTTELRCVVCQNQSLAESNSALAADLRAKIYQKIVDGQPNKEIIDFLTDRYGNFILYRPPFNWSTAGLWLSPYLLLISALSYLFFYLLKRRKN